jgi:hypothetical protein
VVAAGVDEPVQLVCVGHLQQPQVAVVGQAEAEHGANLADAAR